MSWKSCLRFSYEDEEECLFSDITDQIRSPSYWTLACASEDCFLCFPSDFLLFKTGFLVFQTGFLAARNKITFPKLAEGQ